MMRNITDSLYNLRLLDDLARKETSIHRLHPLAKLLTTIAYLSMVISFGRYEISGLMPFVFYPALILAFAEIPAAPVIKRILLIEPFIIGIGILNPLFDSYAVNFIGFTVSRGWVTFLSIFIKSVLTVAAGILLIATTEIDRLAAAMRMVGIPRIFILQLLLTYRYISILTEEASRMLRAYSLRAPGQKGIHRSVWGSFAGQLLLRTYERAHRVYVSMSLRGFEGEYNIGDIAMPAFKDYVYFAGWSLFFVIARIYNIPELAGSLIIGVIK